ncbi:MAG: hypothetical protein COB67_09095 [SAR324 cluster bacterium]|uniref:Probable membrane transporter protein n=1 Tax=SAR324 cluster bacterium TaxID=2024889 RepID=A0A2A4T0Q7_9DELT|nr:MAG: hypothetical protein COB67_09095 [SAR324 cluster bacterium]
MSTESLVFFLLMVAFGSYVQTVTGFAMGLIVMGTVTIFDLASISFASIVVSFLALWNGLIALRSNHESINLKITRNVLTGLLPSMIGGVYLLNYLSQSATHTIKLGLGIVVIGGGLLLMLKPQPRVGLEPQWSFILSGFTAGWLGGLFSTSGPPLVYHLYRQPLSIVAIRTTLLSIFLFSAAARIIVVGLQGQITTEVIKFSLFSMPVVTIFTLLGNRFPPPLSDENRRRMAFILLIIIGLSLAGTGINYQF